MPQLHRAMKGQTMLKRKRSPRARKTHRDRSRAAARRRLGTESLEPRIVLDSTVVFNELMYNTPDETDATGEWIELYNQLAVDMDISEWELRGGVDYTFPDNTIVPGRGFLVVAASPADVEVPEGVQVVGPYSGLLANGGEQVRLFNNDDRLLNTIDYNDGGSNWPLAPDGSGATLAKRHALTSSEDSDNWTSSISVGGTPGAANFDEVVFGSTGPDITELVPEGGPATAFVPVDDSLGLTWIDPSFDDAGWRAGNAGVGFDSQSTYEPFINLDVADVMDDTNASIYIRMDFSVPIPAEDMQSFFLQMQYDDGFVAYLNGTEVASSNAPEDLTWDAKASLPNPDVVAVNFADFDITAHKDLLVDGNNVLAIHGMNFQPSSNDFLISPPFWIHPSGGGDSHRRADSVGYYGSFAIGGEQVRRDHKFWQPRNRPGGHGPPWDRACGRGLRLSCGNDRRQRQAGTYRS